MDLAPRTPGQPGQAFDTEMVALQGQLFGDPDFDTLRIHAGSNFNLPSPGQTTLTQLPSGNFNVDSFFDVSYRITFQGAPGSALEGLGGQTTDSLRMEETCDGVDDDCNGVDDDCDSIDNDCDVVLDGNGNGTIALPPYYAPAHDKFGNIMLARSSNWTIVSNSQLSNIKTLQTAPGGNLGGQIDIFSATLDLALAGSGELQDFTRIIQVPVTGEVHSSPRDLTNPTQSFDTEIVAMQGSLFGDPDFDRFDVRVGRNFGLPSSTGHTSATDIGGGQFRVESFFDIHTEISIDGGINGTPVSGNGIHEITYVGPCDA